MQSRHPEKELPTTSWKKSYISREDATLLQLLRCAEPVWETLDTENCSDIKIYCHALLFRERGMINNPCVSYQGKHFQNIFYDWSASSTSPPYWDTLGAKLLMFAKGTQRKALKMQIQLEISFSIITAVFLMTQTQFWVVMCTDISNIPSGYIFLALFIWHTHHINTKYKLLFFSSCHFPIYCGSHVIFKYILHILLVLINVYDRWTLTFITTPLKNKWWKNVKVAKSRLQMPWSGKIQLVHFTQLGKKLFLPQWCLQNMKGKDIKVI